MNDIQRGDAWLAVAEAYAPLIEATAGHRAQLEAAGFSPTASEMMAVDFHRSLMVAVIGKAKS